MAFVDGAAKLEAMIAALVKVSDAVLILVQPSPYDIWAVSDLVDLIKARQEVTEERPKAAFVICRAIKRTILGREVVSALAEYRHPALRAFSAQRQSYPRTAADRPTVFDKGNQEAAAEIRAIADELSCLLRPGEARHVA